MQEINRKTQIFLRFAFIYTLYMIAFIKANHIEMYLGGGPGTKTEVKGLDFFPDFRDDRIYLSKYNFNCNLKDDCETEKTVKYKSEYGTFKFKYFVGKININFTKDRIIQSSDFYYVLSSDEHFSKNVIGLNENSRFLRLYFEQSTRKSELLRLRFGPDKGIITQVSPYLYKKAKVFSINEDYRNNKNFYLEMTLEVTLREDNSKILHKEEIRLCPFSNPSLTNWDDVFLSGNMTKITELRTLFKTHNEEHIVSLVHKPSKSALKMNEIFAKKLINQIFKLSYVDSNFCDLYFGFEFVRFFKMDFLIGYEKETQKTKLYFDTPSEIQKPFVAWTFGIGSALILCFIIIVLRTDYVFLKTSETEKEILRKPLINT